MARASKKNDGNSSFIRGRKDFTCDYYCGPYDFSVGPDMMHRPSGQHDSVDVKVKRNQRLAPLNSEVANHATDEA